MKAISNLLKPATLANLNKAIDYKLDPLEFFSEVSKDGADFQTLKIGPSSLHLLNHPDLIKEVFSTQSKNFLIRSEGQEVKVFSPIFGNGLGVSKGQFWHRQRHLVQSAFKRSYLLAYGNEMTALTKQETDQWHSGQIANIRPRMVELSRKIITAITLGKDALQDFEVFDSAFNAAIEEYDLRDKNWLLYFLPAKFPTSSNLKYQQAMKNVDCLLYELIEKRAQVEEEAEDILSILMRIEDSDGNRMTDVELRDEIMNILIAHDSVADIFTWAWWLLAQNPDVEKKLVDEWQTVLGGRYPNTADIPNLRYTEWVVKETLRLYPLAWAVGRVAIEDCEINGNKIRSGEHIVMSQWVTHRDPRFFEKPEVFNPDRWSDENAKDIPAFAYYPFGGGPRVCIGRGLAMMEATLGLATIGQQFKMQPINHHTIEPPKPGPSFMLRPQNDAFHVELMAR